MPKRRKRKAGKAKAPKVRHGPCGECGETGKTRSVVLQVDGKTKYSARVCVMCAAIKVVKVSDDTSRG